MTKFNFEILVKDNKSGARLGEIHTAHGDIKTPAFVPVGTQATVKSLSNEELFKIGVQIFFVNTYHTCLRPGTETIKKIGGLHKFIGWNRPLMTDSAGFQVFSLGDVNRKKRARISEEAENVPLVKINEDGVIFRSHLDGSEHNFTPEKSIEAQVCLGADIMIAFDECTYYPATHDYAKAAMQRTHRWALRCLKAAQGKQSQGRGVLYGVIQGGVFEDLRVESAKYIDSLPFEGNAIGGVSVGESKKEMCSVLDWVVPLLSEEKPRHLLGVGEIDDIFTLVERGIDTFDCVMPTRLGRMGHALVNVKSEMSNVKTRWTIDITKSRYSTDKNPLDNKCGCFVCKNYSRAYLNHLFRVKELLGYRLLTYHNLYFVEMLMNKVRKGIEEGKFSKLKSEWL